MKQLAFLVALLMLGALVPTVQAVPPSVDSISVTLNGASPGTIELISSAGDVNMDVLQFSVDGSGDILAGEIRLTPLCTDAPCKVLLVALSDADADDTWTGTLAINNAGFVATDWTVTARLIGGDGVDEESMPSPLVVRATHDTTLPSLEIPGQQGGRYFMGIGQSLQITPQDPLLSLVTYAPADLVGSPVKVASPYSLAGSKFSEGAQLVAFEAWDRALRHNAVDVTVHKDTTDPEISHKIVADAVYRDVPFLLRVNVTDISPHNVTVEFDGQVYHNEIDSVPNGVIVHAFSLEVDSIGLYNASVFVVDELGNSEGLEFNLTAVEPVADVAVASIVTSPTYPLAGDTVDITVSVKQVTGVKSQDVNVRVDLGGYESLSKGETLGIGQSASLVYTVRPVVGANLVEATIGLDDTATIEALTANNTDNITFQMYYGKVEYRGLSFYIRAGPDGLPQHAVDVGGNASALSLSEIENAEVWTFTVDGVELFWDPASRVTQIPYTEDGGNGADGSATTPGLGAPLVLAAIAAGAWASRRRH